MRDPDEERPTDAHDVVDESSVDEDGATVTTVSDDHLRNGTDVGGYVIDGALGAGGMGVVYSAVHPIIGKRAAIKILKPELSGNPAAVERFMMEARAVNQIGHPNIVDIFAFGQLPDGRSYYVMDLLSGEPLRRRLKRGGPLHPAEAISIIDETASALMAAHDKGIVHRDLKPDNVFMVSAPGRWPEVRILDWGLLKLTSQQSSISSSKYRTLAGSVMGTPVYMSPEQARASDAVDFRTDVYSLGVMSYELLAGVVPFKKGSSIDTLLAHQDDPVPPLADKCPALPIELVQLIEAMLAKDPDGRPTLAAVRAVIKRLRGTKIPTMTAAGLQMPEPAPPTPRPSFVEPASDPRVPPTSPHLPSARTSAPSPAPFAEPPTSPHLPSSARTGSTSSPPPRPSSPFVEPPTSPALMPGGHEPSPATRLSAETTVPRVLSTSSQPPTIPRTTTPTSQRAQTADRAPTPRSASVVGNLSAPPALGRAQTPTSQRAPSAPATDRAQTPTSQRAPTAPATGRAQTPTSQRAPTAPTGRAQTSPSVVGRAPSQPSLPRTRTPAGGLPRPETPAGGTRAQTRNEAATVPPPMRAQGPDDRRPATSPGGLPLPAPPRSERMAAQPDPELDSQNVSLPYQSFNLAPTSTLAGHSMPSAPLSSPGPASQNIATSTHGASSQSAPLAPAHGASNQSAPLATMPMAPGARNQTGPMAMMPRGQTGPIATAPHGAHNQTGPMAMMPRGQTDAAHDQTGPMATMPHGVHNQSGPIHGAYNQTGPMATMPHGVHDQTGPMATMSHGLHNQTGPIHGAYNQTGPMATMPHGVHNQTGPMATMPHGAHNQTGPIHGAHNQTGPMATMPHGVHNQTGPMAMMPHGAHDQAGPIGVHGTSTHGMQHPAPGSYGLPPSNPGLVPGSVMSTPYGAPHPMTTPYPQAAGTPQAMTATSGGGMKRVLVIALAAIIVSAIGIAIVMLT